MQSAHTEEFQAVFKGEDALLSPLKRKEQEPDDTHFILTGEGRCVSVLHPIRDSSPTFLSSGLISSGPCSGRGISPGVQVPDSFFTSVPVTFFPSVHRDKTSELSVMLNRPKRNYSCVKPRWFVFLTERTWRKDRTNCMSPKYVCVFCNFHCFTFS